jgi:hypothetical protein
MTQPAARALLVEAGGVGQIDGRDNDLLSKQIVHDTEKNGPPSAAHSTCQ